MFTKRSLPGMVLALLAAFAPACVAANGEGDAADESSTVGTVSQEIITASGGESSITDIPFYFAVPKHALSAGGLAQERQNYPWSTVWSPSRDNPALGLRMIAIPEAGVTSRLQMSEKLGAAGVIQDGDVVLSFRTFLADTMAYPAIQMGSTHASLAFLDSDGGPAHNLDQPLDGEYNKVVNGRFVTRFDVKHYVGADDSTDALHILRPRWPAEERVTRKANLRSWVAKLGQTHQQIRAAGGLNFNSDYLKPLITPTVTAAKITTELGHVMLGKIKPRQDFDMFCSEMSFHLLTLSNCTQADIMNAPVGGEAPCAVSGAPFKPMKLLGDANNAPGLAEGPLLNILHSGGEPPANALEQIFAEHPGGASKLSSGHRAVAEATKPLMGGIQAYYTARKNGQAAQADGIAAQVNASTGNVENYSPTAFLVESMIPDASQRSMDYVATVVFTDKAATTKAANLVPRDANGRPLPGPVPADAP